MKRGGNIYEKLMNEKYSPELCFVPVHRYFVPVHWYFVPEHRYFVPVHRYSPTILSKQMFPRDLFTGLCGQINTLPTQDTSFFLFFKINAFICSSWTSFIKISQKTNHWTTYLILQTELPLKLRFPVFCLWNVIFFEISLSINFPTVILLFRNYPSQHPL